MESKEIIITYETLFDLLKREKDRVELQKLEPEFFANVLSYLREKRQFAQQQSQGSYDEAMKANREIDNIRKIIKEFYDRREKKLVLIALDQSRTKSNLVDYSHMLKDERDFFDQITGLLDAFRDGILGNILNERLPAVHTSLEAKRQEQHPLPSPPSFPLSPGQSAQTGEESQDASDGGTKQAEGSQKPTALLRFLHPVPKFVGPELDEYGPFAEDDIASLPREVAEVLLSKGRVEEIHEE